MSKPSAKRATEPDAIADEKQKGIKATERMVNGNSNDTLDGQEG